jgi:hypothetical protein
MNFPKRTFRFLRTVIVGSFRVVSLVTLLAVLTAIPLFQLISLGYLLMVAGRLAGGAKFHESLPGLHQAGQIGMAAVAVGLASLPTQLLAHWESVAVLIDPGSTGAVVMRWLAFAASAAALTFLMGAWALGGNFKDYFWPFAFCFSPMKYLASLFRWSAWRSLPDRLWCFTASLDLPTYFWLGLRGALGTLVWLIPAFVIIIAFREGETGVAGLVGVVALMALGISMLYLPMLQANFAAENRLLALFDVRRVRDDFRHAPWAWLGAMLLTLLVLPLPLYFLKIEATQREVMWLPCLVFVAFMLPARIATGLALRRCRRKPLPVGLWATISRWSVRLIMPLVVAVYLGFVYVSQYTSWDGLGTWVAQHAVLIPVPFADGT